MLDSKAQPSDVETRLRLERPAEIETDSIVDDMQQYRRSHDVTLLQAKIYVDERMRAGLFAAVNIET
jgi:hypothetical protein